MIEFNNPTPPTRHSQYQPENISSVSQWEGNLTHFPWDLSDVSVVLSIPQIHDRYIRDMAGNHSEDLGLIMRCSKVYIYCIFYSFSFYLHIYSNDCTKCYLENSSSFVDSLMVCVLLRVEAPNTAAMLRQLWSNHLQNGMKHEHILAKLNLQAIVANGQRIKSTYRLFIRSATLLSPYTIHVHIFHTKKQTNKQTTECFLLSKKFFFKLVFPCESFALADA